MAEEENEVQEGQENENEESKSSESGKKSLLPWILLGVIVPICAIGGFGMGRLLAGGDAEEETKTQDVVDEDIPDYMELISEESPDQKTWYFQAMEPVVANLADPGATRYVRAGFILEMSGTFDQTAGEPWLTEKAPLIGNWVRIYLNNQTVEDLQTERNQMRVQSEIRDLLNERLFPDIKGPIVSAFFKEFTIQ